MAEAKKIALTNLADLRSDLGLTQDEMASAIKPMTRQTLGTIENGELKDALFLRGMFERLKAAFGHGFEKFELVEDPSGPNRFLIRYTKSALGADPENNIDIEEYRILQLIHRVRRSMNGDLTYLTKQHGVLRDLHDTLHEWFET